MLHAAAMLAGIFLIAVLASVSAALPAPIAVAGAIAAACVLWAARFGGIWRGYSRLPAMLGVMGAQLAAACAGALRVVRLAAGARVRVRSSLLKLKPRFSSAPERTLYAAALSMSAGRIVVESDQEGVLAHLLNEPLADEAAFHGLEARVRRALGVKAQRS